MRIAKRRFGDAWREFLCYYWCNSLDLTFGGDCINYAAGFGTPAEPFEKEYKSEFWLKFKKI